MWLRAANADGRGRLWDGERLQYAPRLSYEVFNGPIPEGLDVLHDCDAPRCIEPAHLKTGTQADNNADRDARGHNGGWKNRGRKRGPSKQRGMGHALSKLSEEQARFVLLSDQPNAALAREFGVSEGLIRGIRAGRNWGWLKE